MKNFFRQNALYMAWAVSLLATLGSLYFSQILGLPPCVLCWFQRIFMYPMVFILGVGILRRDSNVAWYGLPLSVIGGLISVYHNLLYYKILPESVAPCVNGVSCTSRTVDLAGFITIPLMALLGFIATTALMYYHLKLKSGNN